MNNKSENTKTSVKMLLMKSRTLIALTVLLIIFGVLTPNFFTVTSLVLVAKHVALYAILGIGMTAVIVSGGIDLSVGSIVGLSGVIAGGLILEGLPLRFMNISIYFSVPVVIILTLICGTLVGALNGLLISCLNVPPFITTLGTMYISRGFALIRSSGETYSNLVGKPVLGNTGFPLLGSGVFVGLPIAVWIMIIIALIVIFLFKKQPLGWHIFAVGGNEKAAELSGVKVKNVKLFVYMLSGFCASIVGLIAAAQLVSAHPATGESWEMNAITAAVLGGTSMSGGVGTIGGTILGAFVIGVLNDGMVMLGISEFWQMVIKGGVIIVAVIVDQFQRKMETADAIKLRNE
jgi:Ribose/xylose/arabinose/galactoside ABC-type transport systems, permease components